MSRTYRCKDARERDPKRYLKSLKAHDDSAYCTGWYWGTPENEKELFNIWYFTHGESRNANQRSPSKWWRQYSETAFNTHNKRELQRWKKDPDNYEPQVFASPRSCFNAWWNWM
jgi:hypothetical protein